MIANYANDTYKHKYYVVNAWAIISGFWFHWNLSSSLKFEGKAQLSLKFEWRTQIWVTNSNLSETVWYPPDLSEPSNLSDHPELRESRQITQNWVLHQFLGVVIYLLHALGFHNRISARKGLIILSPGYAEGAGGTGLRPWKYKTTGPVWCSPMRPDWIFCILMVVIQPGRSQGIMLFALTCSDTAVFLLWRGHAWENIWGKKIASLRW